MPLKKPTITDLSALATAQAGKTEETRLGIAQTIMNALASEEGLDSMINDINRAERGTGLGRGAATQEDIDKLTAILGTEPDADEIEIYLAAENAELEQRRRMAEQKPLTGLGAIPMVASAYDAMAGSEEISNCVDTICAFPEEMTSDEAKRLYIALRHSHMEVGIGESYGADFDVSAEIGEQIALVRAMRARLINEEGKLNDRFSAKEAKEIMGASNALNQTLMKFQAQITNFQRLIKVENAVKAALSTLPREAQDTYLQVLEQQLNADTK